MSSDSYQPFSFSAPPPAPAPRESVTERPPVSSPRHRTVTAPEGFEDWGKGADFRQFQRERAKSVTTVTAFSGEWPWAPGLDRLHALPKPGWMRADRWEELLFDAVRFTREWGAQAVRRGWTELELFGCNANPQARRLDNDGLIILLRGRRITAIDGQTATIQCSGGGTLRFSKAEPAAAIPLWVAFSSENGP